MKRKNAIYPMNNIFRLIKDNKMITFYIVYGIIGLVLAATERNATYLIIGLALFMFAIELIRFKFVEIQNKKLSNALTNAIRIIETIQEANKHGIMVQDLEEQGFYIPNEIDRVLDDKEESTAFKYIKIDNSGKLVN